MRSRTMHPSDRGAAAFVCCMAASALAACGNAATDPSGLIVRTAMIEDVFAEVVTSAPVRVEVTVTGNFRDSCAEIGDVSQSRDASRFDVRMNTTRPADAVCSQVLVPFDTSVVLTNTDDLPPGEYVVDVNDVTDAFVIAPQATLR